MVLELTQNTLDKLESINIDPRLAFVIDGISTIFGVSEIKRYIRIGDDGLLIGDDWKIGGLSAVADQASYIMVGGSGAGTTTSIQQNLYPDKGSSSSVSSMTVSLIDKNGELSELFTPGGDLVDILGARARVLIGFEGTSYPEDYVILMRGVISDVEWGPGFVNLVVDHPDTKKRQQIFKKASTLLNGSINDSVTTIQVDNTALFLTRSTGPDGLIDEAFKTYIRIDDEIIEYQTKDGTNFLTCTRGALNTVNVAHDNDATVESVYQLNDYLVPLALKTMLSGTNGYFETGLEYDRVNQINADLYVEDSIFFSGVDVSLEYGIVAGDYVTCSGSEGGVNDFTLEVINEVVKTDDGSYIVFDGLGLTDSASPSGVIALRSQYDTLGDGLKMKPIDVDVAEHETLGNRYLGGWEYDFRFTDTVDGKEFLEKEVYLPAAAYAIPRKSKASLGITIPPVPTESVPIIDEYAIKNPSKVRIKRSISKNFFNAISYEFDKDPLSGDFKTFVYDVDQSSIERIGAGIKQLSIKSAGMRTANLGVSNASVATGRRLNRYMFAAESIESLEMLFRSGFAIEIGDRVILNTENLKIYNRDNADRSAFQRLFEVTNKTIDIKTGNVKVTLVDPAFGGSNRYGMISPSSKIKSVVSLSELVIEGSYSEKFGDREYRKWTSYLNPVVVIRAEDSSVVSDPIAIDTLDGNTVHFVTDCSIAPSAGYVMEFCDQPSQTEEQKLIYASMRDTDFADGKLQYRMI